jgi:anaerobic magnesium-protoporphyrin IX monomethyl ester cyclase
MAKVLFVQDIVYEYFGVMYLSAYLKQHGHQCEVVIEYADKSWLQKAEAFQPDLIAFSVLTGSYKWAVEKAGLLKNKFNKPVIFGGVHVFLNPAKTIQESCIDIVCTGEGEIPLKELCDSIDSGAIDNSLPGFWFKTAAGDIKKNPPAKLINDLDTIPFADRSIYWKYPTIADRDTLPMLGSRGCPYTCTYCFIPSAKKLFQGQGDFIRERSAEGILAEIENCLTLSPDKETIHFVEDHFGNNRKQSLTVLQGISKLKGGKMSWMGAIRVERFNKEEYVEELSKTNHGLLGIAVECGDEKYRKEVLKRDVKNDEIVDAANLARKYGIKFTTLNMLGLPGETFEQSLLTLDLNIQINPVYANCYVYQPFPGTELQKYSVEHHLLDESMIDNIGLSFYDRYWKNNASLNQIINLQRVFGLIVKFPSLKKPLVYLARNNWRIAVDLIFGMYYAWFLAFYYNLTPSQIFQLISLWVSNKFSWAGDPSSQSIKQGEGQLYPNMSKG